MKPVGLPKASTGAGIFVLNPPRLRPIASSSPPFARPGPRLLGADDRGSKQGGFIIHIDTERREYALPHAPRGPAAEAARAVLPIPEPRGQVAPGTARPIALQHGRPEQPVIPRRPAHMPHPPRQQGGDPPPLVIPQPIAPGHAPSGSLIRAAFLQALSPN